MKKIYKLCGFATLCLAIILLCNLIRINRPVFVNSIYNSYDKENYQYNGITVTADPVSGKVTLSSATNELNVSLPRDPGQLESVNSFAIYGNGNKVYYLCEEEKQNSFQMFSAQEPSDFFVVELNLESFEEEVVFSTADIWDNSAIKQTIISPLTSYFFMNSDSLYIATDKLWEINIYTGKLDLVPIECNYANISFDGDYIYYIGDDSRLYRYNTNKNESNAIAGIIAKDFFLGEGCVYYLNRLDKEKIYAYTFDTQKNTKIIDTSATGIFTRKGKIVYISKEDGLIYCAELDGTNIMQDSNALLA